jgi:hypothetical protein
MLPRSTHVRVIEIANVGSSSRFLCEASAARLFEQALEPIERSFRLCVYGYVVTPRQVHLLASVPERSILADAIKSLKQGVSPRVATSMTRVNMDVLSNVVRSHVTMMSASV